MTLQVRAAAVQAEPKWLDLDAGVAQTIPDWTGPDRYDPEVGFFTEIVTPTVDRFETRFSNDRVEVVSVGADGLSGQIQEHGYWGGARDRMPLAQVDRLPAEGHLEYMSKGHLVRVPGQGNLCLIRSGQEWTGTVSAERALYLDDVERFCAQVWSSCATMVFQSAASPPLHAWSPTPRRRNSPTSAASTTLDYYAHGEPRPSGADRDCVAGRVHLNDCRSLTDLACFPFTTEADLSESYPLGVFAGSFTP